VLAVHFDGSRDEGVGLVGLVCDRRPSFDWAPTLGRRVVPENLAMKLIFRTELSATVDRGGTHCYCGQHRY
jgi:hypothetical protein